MVKYITVFLFIFFTIATQSYAILPPRENPLIIESIVLEPTSPIQINHRTWMGDNGGVSHFVTNTSSTPFFLFQNGKNYCTPFSYPPEFLKAGFNASSIGNRGSYFNFYKLQEEKTYKWECYPSEKEYKWIRQVSPLYVSGQALVDDKSSYCVVPDLNIYACGDSRFILSPSNIKLPNPKSFTLKGYMDEREIILKGTVSFERNQDFDASYWMTQHRDQVEQKAHQEYIKQRNYFLRLLLQGIALVALLGALFVIRKKMKKQNNPLVEQDAIKMKNVEVLDISDTPNKISNLSKFLKAIFFTQIVVFALLLIQIIFFASTHQKSSHNPFLSGRDSLYEDWRFTIILTLRDVVDQNLILLLPVLFLVGVIGNYFYKKQTGVKLKNLSYANIISFFAIVFWIIVIFSGFLEFGIGAGKPVIYLYPQNKMPVSVTLKLQGDITDTYPTIDSHNSWNVTAYPDGLLTDSFDGREYSYLFWEGIFSKRMPLPNQGFVVAGKDTKDFLQAKLSEIGLTPKEYNEFIVYWLPKMQHNPYNHIYFAANDYTDRAVLDIVPKPDSMLRVFMMYKSLDGPIEVEKQSFAPFSRSGFTVVEWGGDEVK